MKILLLDIETSPNTVYTWGLYNQNVALNQVVEQTKMICFVAKWYGQARTIFKAGDMHPEGSTTEMLDTAWELINEAAVVVHYNGTSFDMKHLNREFAMEGLGPPSPVQELDLLRVVKKNFRFPSNKLENVSRQLGLEGKVQHSGFSLWTDCMAGDAKAWRQMEKYNRRDVTLLEELYDELLPWITNHPNRGLFTDETVCPNCGSSDLEKRGFRHTRTGTFQQYRCRGCGSWPSSGRRIRGTDLR